MQPLLQQGRMTSILAHWLSDAKTLALNKVPHLGTICGASASRSSSSK
jgi:hypothetical protein